jgi:hypothetical protein
MKRLIVVLSAITALSLSTAPKASALDLSGFADGLLGSLSEQGYISKGLAENLSFYTSLGEALLQFIDTKSLNALTSILPSILDKYGANNCKDYEGECSDLAGDDSVIGEAGQVDWGKVSESVSSAVDAAVSESDAGVSSEGKGAISSGVTDKRFRPRITTLKTNTEIAAWTQLQDAQLKVILSEDGQKFTQEGRDAVAKIVEESGKTTADIAKLDNTQDIIKKGEINKTLGIAMQQRQIEEQLQTRIATYEGNQTATQQLSIQQKQDWMKEVERSQAQQSADAEGKAFSAFIGSAYTDSEQSPQ